MFSLEFPSDCGSYHGPHSKKCLAALWDQSGCTGWGIDRPQNLESNVVEALAKLNLR